MSEASAAQHHTAVDAAFAELERRRREGGCTCPTRGGLQIVRFDEECPMFDWHVGCAS